MAIAVLACIFGLMSPDASWAQSQKVSLTAQRMTLGQAFSEIEKQTELIFTVNHALVDLDRRVRFSGSNLTLGQTLDQLTAQLGFTYSIVRKHIVLVPEEKKAEPVVEIPVVEPEPEPVIIEAPVVPDTVRRQFSYSASGPVDLRTPGAFTGELQGSFPGRKKQPSMAIKTNLLYAATLTPNLCFEIGTGINTTLNISAGYNPWNVDGTFDDNDKFAHRLVQAEFRYWPCERFNGHFWGVHAFAADYNIGGYDVPLLFKKEYRYEGWAVGAGVNYGYHLILKKRWSLEFAVGVGVAYLDYDRYACDKCAQLDSQKAKWYFGPTKLGISLVYIIK